MDVTPLLTLAASAQEEEKVAAAMETEMDVHTAPAPAPATPALVPEESGATEQREEGTGTSTAATDMDVTPLLTLAASAPTPTVPVPEPEENAVMERREEESVSAQKDIAVTAAAFAPVPTQPEECVATEQREVDTAATDAGGVTPASASASASVPVSIPAQLEKVDDNTGSNSSSNSSNGTVPATTSEPSSQPLSSDAPDSVTPDLSKYKRAACEKLKRKALGYDGSNIWGIALPPKKKYKMPNCWKTPILTSKTLFIDPPPSRNGYQHYFPVGVPKSLEKLRAEATDSARIERLKAAAEAAAAKPSEVAKAYFTSISELPDAASSDPAVEGATEQPVGKLPSVSATTPAQSRITVPISDLGSGAIPPADLLFPEAWPRSDPTAASLAADSLAMASTHLPPVSSVVANEKTEAPAPAKKMFQVSHRMAFNESGAVYVQHVLDVNARLIEQ